MLKLWISHHCQSYRQVRKRVIYHIIVALLYLEKAFFAFRAALDIQKSLDAPLHQMKALVKKWSLKFHERHYLVILVRSNNINVMK